MASGNGSSDGLGGEQHTRTNSLGKTTLEGNKTSVALESKSGPEKNQNPNTPSTQNAALDLTPLSKGKQALQDSKDGHDSIDQSKQSSTSWSIRSFQDALGIFPSSDEEHAIALGPSSSSRMKLIQAHQEADFQTNGPDPAHSNLEGVAALASPTNVEPNMGSVVALPSEASLKPNGDALVVSNDRGRAEPLVGPIVVLRGVAPAQSNVALIVAPSGEVPAQPNIAPNAAPRAPVQRNAPLIVAPPGVAVAQPNAAVIVAPPAIVVLDVNHGLNRSRLKPLRICEMGFEGHFWPKHERS